MTDQRRRVAYARFFIGIMFGTTIAGFWAGATTVVLIANAVVWGLWFAAKGDELRLINEQAQRRGVTQIGEFEPLKLPRDN